MTEPERRVVVLRPPVPDEVTADALSRVQGELTAAGFDVRVIRRDPALPVRVALETSGRELDPIATFAIVRPEGRPEARTDLSPEGTGGARGVEPSGDTAEIWVSDRVAGRSVIQTVRLPTSGLEVDPKRKAIVLAVRAVELLKASLADYWIEPARPPAETPPAPASPPTPPATPSPVPAARPSAVEPMLRHGLAVQAAVGWLDSIGTTIGPVWQPVLRAAYSSAVGWGGRLTLAGLGSEARLVSEAGTARVGQTLAVFELVRSFSPLRRLRLHAALGLGGYHVRAEGTASEPNQANSGAFWSALGGAGAGAAVALAPRLAVTLEGQAFLSLPRNHLLVGETPFGRAGWPSILLSAGILGAF